MRFAVSNGGMGGMGGNIGGGMGMMEEPSLWGQFTMFLDTLPAWLSTIIIAAGVILIAMFVGWIVGQITGRIIYPNPDKPSVLNKKEKMIYSGVLCAAILLIIMVAVPKSDEDLEVGMGDIGGADSSMSGENPSLGGDDILVDDISPEGVIPEGDGSIDEATDSEAEGDTSSDETSSESSSSESSSQAAPPITPQPRSDTPTIAVNPAT